MAGWQERCFSRHDGPEATTLLVLIHGLRGSSEQLGSVAEAALSAVGPADVYVPAMPYGGWLGPFDPTPPTEAVCALAAAITALDDDRQARTGGGYERITLIGYSLGALIVRKLAIIAHGERPSAPFEAGLEAFVDGRRWADRINRIVLIGGVSRGWAPRAAGSWLMSLLWRSYSLLATLLPAHRGTLMESRFGLPFPVQTRLQWLAMVRELHRELPVVQLLGSSDNIVSPDDMMDVAVDGVANRQHALLDMEASGHFESINMGQEPGAASRRRLLQEALQQDMQMLAKHPDAISSALLSDGKTPEPEPEVTDVVFVVHGIRDKGFWTSKVARKIKREAAKSPLPDGTVRRVRSMTESYGYLAMLPFLWVGVRRAKAAWLMDRYVDARARYPLAKFHFVGHSNGTYLGARALRDYPAALFERIVFAGSVVRTDYDWQRLIAVPRPQVGGLLNYVASSDLVVGIFPAALRIVDLGGAGHSGFRDIDTPGSSGVGRVAKRQLGNSHCYQVQYVRGGHGAGIVETQWDEIASFIINGTAPQGTNADYVGQQSAIARLMGAMPPLGLLLVLLAYAAIALAVWLWTPAWFVILFAILSLIILFRV